MMLLHRQFSTTTTALAELFLLELTGKHEVESTVFTVNGANPSNLHVSEQNSEFR